MNYQPVSPPARWRWRRWWRVARRVAGVVLPLGLWVGGVWWSVDRLMAWHPDPSPGRAVEAAAVYALLWGAALRQPWRRRR